MVAYSFKERFIAPIEVGLGREITGPSPVDFPAPKLQTIRAIGKRRHARPGEILQLYYGMRTKMCRLIGVAKCFNVLPTTILISAVDADLTVFYDGKLVSCRDTEQFARSDGFGSVEDMWLFWRREHPDVTVFEGFTISWAPITGEP